MREPKDWWDKTDIVAKVLVPVVVATLGATYTWQQHLKDDSQKSTDRGITLGKSLSRDNPREQQFAMVMLRNEKEKYPANVPNDLLAVALPPLLRLAATAPTQDVAANAKQLAIDLSANTNVADSVKKSVERTPARIYFHIRDEAQRATADADARQLQSRLGDDFVVPGVERVASGPGRTELRYFRMIDEPEAIRIDEVLKEIGVENPA